MKGNMKRNLATAFGVLGFLGVALGAFGAHGLRDKVTERALENWKTATLYLLVHALAGLVSLTMCEKRTVPTMFLVGCVVFSGSLYALVLSGVGFLGAVTPLGGVAFLAGWLLFTLELRRNFTR